MGDAILFGYGCAVIWVLGFAVGHSVAEGAERTWRLVLVEAVAALLWPITIAIGAYDAHTEARDAD